jgi:hypothetical protein
LMTLAYDVGGAAGVDAERGAVTAGATRGLVTGGGKGRTIAVVGIEGILSTSFSDRKIVLLRFSLFSPVAARSRTIGGPSRMVIRCVVVSSCNNGPRKVA